MMLFSVLSCALLSMSLRGALCDCVLENYTLLVEKHGCDQCTTVNTTICSGMCYSQDTNVRGRVGRSYLIQRGCMPQAVVYRAAYVPGCPQHISPMIYYPESNRCHCSRCDGHTHHCVQLGRSTRDTCPRNAGSGKKKRSGKKHRSAT